MKPSSSGGSSPSAPYRAAGSTTARSVSAHDHFRLTARDPEEGPPSLRQQNVHIFLIIYFFNDLYQKQTVVVTVEHYYKIKKELKKKSERKKERKGNVKSESIGIDHENKKGNHDPHLK